jgi:basic membrane protein A and related proteins
MKQFALGLCFFFVMLVPARGDFPTVSLFTGPDGLGGGGIALSAYTGLRKAQEQFDFRLIVEEPGGTGVIRPERMEAVLSKCHIAILLETSGHQNAIGLAERYPEIRFIHFEPHNTAHRNLRAILLDQTGGAFLAGALAGWMTRSGIVGYSGTDFLSEPFCNGVRFADARVRVRNRFGSQEDWIFDRSGAVLDFSGGDHRLSNDVDIIFEVPPPSGIVRLHAIDYRHFYRQHPARPVLLCSLSKRLDLVLHQEITAILEGRFEPGLQFYGIKEGAVQFNALDLGGQAPIPHPVLSKLQGLTAHLMAGDFSPTTDP